ncbi:MAG: quinone-dependent dihydroorotate dehydrogenase [Elusimicrobiota bacterium]
MSLYEQVLRPLLFRLDPETAHDCAARVLELAGRTPFAYDLIAASRTFSDPALKSETAGLRFPNPVGLAAGFDKDCRLADILPAFGFGFLELGTVTARPQPGNPRPRLFRFPKSRALINRFGFNGAGADAAREHLRLRRRRLVPVGINIGLNADAAQQDAPEEYARTFAKLYPHGDYFAVNVSSPNTSGLRRLQDKLELERILRRLQDLNGDRKPIFVKLSPDLDLAALDSLLPMLEAHAAGVICTNTTTSRPDVDDEAAATRGGLSGAPLRDLSTLMIREIYRRTGGRLPIIGVGGIFTAEDAYQKICAGASIVQIYTSFIYRGPGLPAAINRGLARILREQGLKNIGAAVGRSHTVGTGAG